jgi:IS5 family transposase
VEGAARADRAVLPNFAGLRLSEPIPDETTIPNSRHLLEQYDLAEDIFKQVSAHLARKGLLLKRGSIVDATIIAAPSATKNAEGATLTTAPANDAAQGRRWRSVQVVTYICAPSAKFFLLSPPLVAAKLRERREQSPRHATATPSFSLSSCASREPTIDQAFTEHHNPLPLTKWPYERTIVDRLCSEAPFIDVDDKSPLSASKA